jgi:hypothetical protein
MKLVDFHDTLLFPADNAFSLLYFGAVGSLIPACATHFLSHLPQPFSETTPAILVMLPRLM